MGHSSHSLFARKKNKKSFRAHHSNTIITHPVRTKKISVAISEDSSCTHEYWISPRQHAQKPRCKTAVVYAAENRMARDTTREERTQEKKATWKRLEGTKVQCPRTMQHLWLCHAYKTTHSINSTSTVTPHKVKFHISIPSGNKLFQNRFYPQLGKIANCVLAKILWNLS